MALALPDQWVWDSWLVDTDDIYHLFYLQAPRSLGNPDLRHWNASIGHAMSDDLRTWTVMPDALHPSSSPGWDDAALWTGSVVQAPDGGWHLYYTGLSVADDARVQRIGLATSSDLISWQRDPMPAIEADPWYYEKLGDCAKWTHEAWRDPYVFADPGGQGWHMLVCARAGQGPWDERGVVGHLRSADLRRWEAQPPLTRPGAFSHLEVPQVTRLNGRCVLLFSCLGTTRPSRYAHQRGGVWTVAGPSHLGPFDVASAKTIDHPSLYAARLVQDRQGRWVLLGFRDIENGEFIGAITDPIPVHPAAGPAGLARRPT